MNAKVVTIQSQYIYFIVIALIISLVDQNIRLIPHDQSLDIKLWDLLITLANVLLIIAAVFILSGV